MANTEIAPISLSASIAAIKRQMTAQWSVGKRVGAYPLLLGAPGLGKTAVTQAAAREVAASLGKTILCHVVTLVDREVPDIRGMALPARSEPGGPLDSLVYTRSAILPSPAEEEEHDLILLLIDEVAAATLDHIKSVASAFLEDKLGSTHLHPAKYFVIGTGNGVEHRSGAAKLPAHFINRVALMHVEADTTLWLRDFAPKVENGVPPLAMRFVEDRGSLFTEATVPDSPNTPFATLRSFTQGVQALFYYFHQDPKKVDPQDPQMFAPVLSSDNMGLATTLLASMVGAGVAREFIGYARLYGVLTPLAAIEADPKNAPIPKEMSALFAQASYLISWVSEERTAGRKRNTALLIYAGRLRPDLLVPTIQRMVRKQQAITQMAEYSAILRDHLGLVEATVAAR